MKKRCIAASKRAFAAIIGTRYSFTLWPHSAFTSPRMRKSLGVLAILLVLWLGYIVWPFVSLFSVVRAAQAGNAVAIAQRVDFPKLRRSMAVQLLQTYAGLAGVKLEAASVAIGLTAAFADPLVEKLLTPAALGELMRSGWPKATLGEDAPPGTAGLDPAALGNIWQLFLSSDYGIGVVRIGLPTDQPKERQFHVELSLSDWTWKLSSLDLPVALKERLARELMKQQGKT